MNGPISMYKLKPIIHFPNPADLTPMYRMKNIYSSNFSSPEDNPSQETHSFPNVLEQNPSSQEVEDLKKRQEVILKQLKFLKEQMQALREELAKETPSKKPSNELNNNVAAISSHPITTQKLSWNGVAGEIVFSASPEHPPFSLLAVNKLWPGVLRLHVTCHLHSSITSLPPHLTCFSALSLTTNPNVQARLIWNNAGCDSQLVISPLSHTPIRGEVNILRYFHRSIYGIGDPIADTQLDHLLDICHRLVHVQTQRDKQANVRALNALLGHAQWLGGKNLSVADVAAWSAVKNTPGIELSQNMTRWHTRCTEAFEIGAA